MAGLGIAKKIHVTFEGNQTARPCIKMQKFLVSATLILYGCYPSQASAVDVQRPDPTRAVFHYISFDAETFGAMTRSNIDQIACMFSPKLSDREFEKIARMLATKGRRGFDEQKVRLKIEGVGGGVYFIDSNGDIVHDGVNTGTLSRQGRKWLDGFLRGIELDAIGDHCLMSSMPEDWKIKVRKSGISRRIP